MSHNRITLTAYNASGVPVVDDGSLVRVERIRYTTQYPGGLYGALTAWAPRNSTVPWAVKAPHRLVAYNGPVPVWEGRVTALGIEDYASTRGQSLTALGYWGDVLMQRRIIKPWADSRLQDQTWRHPDTAYSANDVSLSDLMSVDLYNRLRFTPRAVAFTANQYQRRSYTMPTGQTIKRITFNYDMQEAGQAWKLELFDLINAAPLWDVTSSGTGSVDHTLATPSNSVMFLFRAMANQTAPGDGTVYGQVSSVVVYTETGAINLTEICKDVRALVSELSAAETLIASNTYSLVPFRSDADTAATILSNAASFGDSSFNPWAVGVRGSWLASDNKPVLFAEAQPTLTTYDYVINQGDRNLVAPFRVAQDYNAIRNYIIVRYQDINGHTQYVTPGDDANLKDTTSIAAYGEYHEVLTVNTTDVSAATNWGRRYLAVRKDPQWRVSGGIRVKGYIQSRAGGTAPACQIVAGKRVKIANYLSNLSGRGLTFLITATDYDDESQTCTLSVGLPDQLAPYLARQNAQT